MIRTHFFWVMVRIQVDGSFQVDNLFCIEFQLNEPTIQTHAQMMMGKFWQKNIKIDKFFVWPEKQLVK